MNLYQPTITGSLSVSGSVNISGSITIAGGGTISGTASIATTALTASFVENAQTASYVLNAVSSSFALTASSADNLLVRNTLTAQTLVVQTITSSVDFVTGSTRFGSISANTHQFTGSMSVSGAAIFSEQLTATSPSTLFKEGFIVKATTTGGGGSQPAYTYYTAAGSKRWSSFLNVGDDKLHIANALNSEVFTIIQSGSVGIGTTDPLSKSHTVGSSTAVNNSGIMQLSTGTAFSSNKLIFGINDGSYAWIQAIHPDVAYRNLVLQSGGGNVGIGTTSPTYKLEVSGSSGTFSFNPNQANTMVIRGSVAGNFDINNEGASGVIRLYGTSIQLRTAALDPAVTITAAGGLQTNLSTISSFYSTPGNVASGGTTTFVYNQTSAEYAVGFEYCIVSLYAPSGTNLYGVAHGFVFFMADGATSASYISQTIANGWTVTHSATNAGVFTVTFTAGGSATHSNINIRTRKINRIGAG
jgi:hypothetical protein